MHLAKQLLYQLLASLRTFQEQGLRAGLVALGQTILRIFYQQSEYIVIANVLSGRVIQLNPEPDLVIRQIPDREEIAKLSQIANQADVARFYEMFDRGSIAFGAFQNDQIVGCCWASQKTQSVNRVQPPLRPGDACVHDLFVSPEHRGQKIGRTLISHRLHFLRERGYKRAVGAILKGNAPAFKINEITGHTHISEMSHTRILFWDFFHHDPFDGIVQK